MVSEDLMLMPNLVPQCEALKLHRADLEQHIKEKKYQAYCALLLLILSETTIWAILAI